MAFSATKVTRRMQFVGMSRQIWLPATPATVYRLGDPIVISNARAAIGAAAGTNYVGVVAGYRIGGAPATTSPPWTAGAASSTLGREDVLVETGQEFPVYRTTLVTPLEDAPFVSAGATANAIVFNTGLTTHVADDTARYRVICCYSGPGKGCRISNAYDDADGGHGYGDQMVTVDYCFDGTLTTSSNFIFLGENADGSGIYPGGLIDLDTTDAWKVAGDDITGAAWRLVSVDDLADDGSVLVCPADSLWHAP